jgi:hypothetical protein
MQTSYKMRMNMTNVPKSLASFMLVMCFAATCLGQSRSIGMRKPSPQDDDDVRGIVPEKFVDRRRRRLTATSRPHSAYKRVPTSKLQTPGGPQNDAIQPGKVGPQYAQLGLTIWRLRKSAATDRGPHLLAPENLGVTQWTPVRAEASTPFTVDDFVRLSIESSVHGYLYVVDRGQYQDGTMSEPQLIFPTTRLRGGDNEVKPGRLIEIPAQGDAPNYMHLKSTHGVLVSELLTIVIAAEPIAGLAEQISPQPLAFDKNLLAKWENAWGGKVEHFELAGGDGKVWTKAEQEAGADATRELTQDDAPPQTIFRVAHASNTPLLVNVELRVRPASPPRLEP